MQQAGSWIQKVLENLGGVAGEERRTKALRGGGRCWQLAEGTGKEHERWGISKKSRGFVTLRRGGRCKNRGKRIILKCISEENTI